MKKDRAIAIFCAAVALFTAGIDAASADSNLSREIIAGSVRKASFDTSRSQNQTAFGLTISVSENRQGEMDVNGLIFSISSDDSGMVSLGDGLKILVPECSSCVDKSEVSRRRRLEHLD